MNSTTLNRILLVAFWIVLALAIGVLVVSLVLGKPLFTVVLRVGWLIVLCIYQIRRLGAARLVPKTIPPAEVLAHWQYSQEEWAAFARRCQQRMRRAVKRLVLIMGLAMSGGAILLFVNLGADKNALIVPLGMLFTSAAILFFLYRAPERGFKRLLGCAPEAWIGRNGVLQAGQYSTWTGDGRQLVSVRLETGPGLAPELVYALRIQGKKVEMRTPVPEGQEGAAADLTRQIST